MLESNTKKLLNDEIYIAAREEWFSKLDGLYNGKKQSPPVRLWGKAFFPPVDPYSNIEGYVAAALEMMPADIDSIMDTEVFRPLCFEFGLYGVHFIDKILGAQVFFQDGQWYNHPLETPVGSLSAPDLECDETWNLAKKAAECFLAQDVKLPLFSLPTIASALNVAVNLYGEEILVSLMTEPNAALHDLEIINELLITIHKWYLVNIPEKQLQPVVSSMRTQPRGYGQICGCTTQLISPDIYRELIAPLDAQLLSGYENGGMMHLCGAHAQHIPTFKAMPQLRAFQLNDRAAADLELYYKGLRDDQILYVNVFEEMSAKKALKITGGNRLVLVENRPKNH